MRDNFARVSRLLMVVFLLAAGLARPSGAAKATGAAIITVNSTSDADAVDGVCTLREAIKAVGGDYHDCHHTGSGYNYVIVFSISGSTKITLSADLPEIDNILTIDGSNSGRPVVIDGANLYEPFSVGISGATLTLKNLTVQHGLSTYGGGVYVDIGGSLIVLNSSFLNNVATSDGGAIDNMGSVTIANSTFSGNSAKYGGGLVNNSGGATILNSTFYSNTASTVGGISTATLRNTIVANNTGGNCSSGTITNGGHNIDSGSTCGWGSSNGSKSNTNPLMGTQTGSPAYFPLLSGSPALDAGSDTVCAAAPVNNTSQNGRRRPQGPHCDIGSYEGPATKTILSTGSQDGWVLESSENSNVGGSLDATATTLQLGDDAAKKQYRSVLSFSTGTPLPDTAVITKVTLKLMKQGVMGGGDPVTTFQGFMLDVKKGFFGTTALQASDFQAGASHTYGPKSPALVGGWYSFDLTSGATYINKLGTNGGLTQIRMRFKLGDNNDSIANYLSLYSGNATTTSSRPQLIVEYYVP